MLVKHVYILINLFLNYELNFKNNYFRKNFGNVFKNFSEYPLVSDFFFLVPLSIEYRLEILRNWSHGRRFLFLYGAFFQWRRCWREILDTKTPKFSFLPIFFGLNRECMVKVNLIFREKRFYWDFNSRWGFLKTV